MELNEACTFLADLTQISFCVDDMTDTNVELLIRRYNLKNLPVRDYRAYRARYPMIREETVIHNARVMIAHVDPLYHERTLEHIDDELPRSPQGWDYTRENFETLVSERYKAETEMMDCVRRGEPKARLTSTAICTTMSALWPGSEERLREAGSVPASPAQRFVSQP